MEANNKVQTEAFPVPKGSISQLGVETKIWQEGLPSGSGWGWLCRSFSCSTWAGQDHQFRDRNPPKLFVSPAMWGGKGTGVATGLGAPRVQGCQLPSGTKTLGGGLKAEVAEGQSGRQHITHTGLPRLQYKIMNMACLLLALVTLQD